MVLEKNKATAPSAEEAQVRKSDSRSQVFLNEKDSLNSLKLPTKKAHSISFLFTKQSRWLGYYTNQNKLAYIWECTVNSQYYYVLLLWQSLNFVVTLINLCMMESFFTEFLINEPNIRYLCFNEALTLSCPTPLLLLFPLGFVFVDSIRSSTTSLGRTEKKGFLGIFQFSRRKTRVILQISVAVFFFGNLLYLHKKSILLAPY